jgi:hypothetical protein
MGTTADEGEDAKDVEIAKSLDAMLSAGLTVISRNQALIDSPDIEDKGLDGKTVLKQARKVYPTIAVTVRFATSATSTGGLRQYKRWPQERQASHPSRTCRSPSWPGTVRRVGTASLSRHWSRASESPLARG